MMLLGALILLCVVLLIGLPVPLAFGAVMIYLAIFTDTDPMTFMTSGHWRMNNLVLLAIPLFIMAGSIMEKGRIAVPMVYLAELFVGRVRGGLSTAAVIASAIFGSISGSAAATLTCIGSVLLPRLRAANYPEGFSASLIANAAPLGLLIPPSSIQIIYAWVTRQSVLKCFLATVMPGLILIILLCTLNLILMARKRRIVVPPPPEKFSCEAARRGTKAFPALMMPVVILGGIYGGIMTPTEAAGVAVLYAIPVGWSIYRGLNRKTFIAALVESGTTTGVVMVMFFTVMIVSRLLIFEDIPGLAEQLIFSVSANPVVALIMINIVIVIIGMLMDDVSGVLLASPLLLPIAMKLGVDPIHFAAIIGVNLGMGNVTPPTAPLLYLGARVANTQVNKMLWPTTLMILFAWLPTLIVTTYVPAVSLWLPNLVLGR